MPKLDSRTAIITGGASGIGLAIARFFAREGASIELLDQNEVAELHSTVEKAINSPSARGSQSGYPDRRFFSLEVSRTLLTYIGGVRVVLPGEEDAAAAEVLAHPDRLFSMDPIQFEDFIASTYRRLGYTVRGTKRSHDGGVDLYMEKDVDGMLHRYILQCKHTAKRQRRIGVAPVRELLGSLLDWAATAAIIVTNTFFSRAARAFAGRHAQHCFCVDKDGILALLRSTVAA